jgi:hypothetical protein
VIEQFRDSEQFASLIPPPVYSRFEPPSRTLTDTLPFAEKFDPHAGVAHVIVVGETADADEVMLCDPRVNQHT